MDSDCGEKIYCDVDDGYHACDKLALDRNFNNHQKSRTHIKNFPKSDNQIIQITQHHNLD